MILYFSGTGNSKYIAKKIQFALGDEIVDLNAKIKSNDHSQIEVKDRLVFVTPTYGWRMPRIVSDFVEKTPFSGEKKSVVCVGLRRRNRQCAKIHRQALRG